MQIKVTAALAALVAGALAAPTNNMVIHQERRVTPKSPARGARLQSNVMLPIRIGLTQSNLERGYDLVMDVSKPSSSNFGKYWSAQKVHDIFAPSKKATQAVKDWLKASGIATDRIMTYENKGWLSVSMSVQEAEALFGTEYHEYTSKDGRVHVGNDKYSLPQHISEHVDYVYPGVHLSAPIQKALPQRRSSDTVSQSSPPPANFAGDCGTTMTPDCLREQYHIPKGTSSNDGNTVGIYETGNNIYSPEDLDNFYKYYAKDINQGTYPKIISVDGAQTTINQSRAGLESNIDIQIIESLVYPQAAVIYQEPDQDNFLGLWMDSLDGSYCTPDERANGTECGVFKPEKVMSISWGGGEVGFDQKYQERTCNEFMKLSLQGHTFVAASGDGGVGERYDPACAGPDNNAFNPNFPATCPWVLAVGATQLTPSQKAGDVETPMNVPAAAGSSGGVFSSAGGFSNIFSAPIWQKLAVEKYFLFHNPGYKTYNSHNSLDNVGANGGRFNRYGRGVPDISANGAHFPVAWRGGWWPVASMAGTSLSAPVVASMLTLVNSERTAQGKGPVGFVQPVMYTFTNIFTDIVGGEPNGNCNSTGFSAVQGWDPITGLGTPDYKKLSDVYKFLP